ncbi:hypothetical protein [Clostridium sp.]|uniref:hypothetical protein n=1 Tax=Clostridium sp. TaxID=1506 RepID=UPI002849E13D|nr:hypothetical protein [Clostridium sp.]MDR3594357.1 hypothetical protein [Clostridium sp.]
MMIVKCTFKTCLYYNKGKCNRVLIELIGFDYIDDELIDMIIEKEKNFWNNNVLKKIPPSIDGSFGATQYIGSKYKVSDKGSEIILQGEYKDKLQKYMKIKENINTLEKSLKQIENNIKNEMKSAERGITEYFLVNWKSILSNRIDAKALKNNYPDVYKNVIKESITRRFEVLKNEQ